MFEGAIDLYSGRMSKVSGSGSGFGFFRVSDSGN